jgi:hypothetical protein
MLRDTSGVKTAFLPITFVLIVAVLLAVAALAAPALSAAAPPQVAGASVLSSTSVKITFSAPVANPSATALANYGIAPALPVSAAALTDAGRSVVLTTATQLNGQTYTVSVANVLGADGTPMVGLGSSSFIGTNQGPVSSTSGHDDFNRPSGLITTDTPIPGPWLSKDISTLNTLSLTGSTVFGGSGALDSFVSDTDPNLDNALVRYQLAAGSEYWLSAYIYVPSGQGWGNQQEVGLIRFMENLQTSMARVSAIDQSSATHFGLNVNWKTTGNKYLTTPPVIATSVPFDSWQWIEMHVRQATASSPGEIQVWLNGKQIYGQDSIYVYPGAKMTYAQTGIMHLVTMGPAAHDFVDEVRFGPTFELPSSRADTTAPGVVLTNPADGSTIGSSVVLTAAATDDTGVQRVEFLIDGAVVNRDDLAPYQLVADTSGLANGTHTLTAIAYDTSGNASAPSSITVTKGSGGGGGGGALSLTAPTDGTSWQQGAAQTLSWSLSSAASSGSFKVAARNTATGTTTALTGSVAAVAGQTSYTAPYAVKLAAGSYAVTVSQFDTSGALVTQSAVSGVTVLPLTLTSPAGGVIWARGSAQSVAWTLSLPLSSGSFTVWAKNTATGTASTLTPRTAAVAGTTAYSRAYSVTLAAGTYTVYVNYYDSTGALVVRSAMNTITVQ